jgi:hypothetical protein
VIKSDRSIFASEFVQIILPVVQIAFPEAEFQLFQGVWKALELISRHPDPAVRWLDADETHTNSKEFISLKNDLDTFINTFDDYARSQNVSFTDAVKAKKAEIAANGTEITKCHTLLAGLERGVAFDLFGVKTDGGFMEGRSAVLAPVTGLSFITVAINSALADASAINAEHEKLRAYKRREATLYQELVDLEQALPDLAKAFSALENQNILFKDIGNRVDHLGTVGGNTIHHAQMLLPIFKVDGNKVTITNSDVLKDHASCILAYQKTLKAGLERYVAKVTS